jgi:hypothetical protein
MQCKGSAISKGIKIRRCLKKYYIVYVYGSEIFKYNETAYLLVFVGVRLVLSDSELWSVTFYSYIE